MPGRTAARRRVLLGGVLAAAGGGLLFTLGNLGAEKPIWSRLLLPSDSFENGWRRAYGVFADSTLIEAAERAIDARRQEWETTPSQLGDILNRSFEDGLAIVQKLSREDYAEDRTVSVGTWLVSRTEAELILLLRSQS